MRQDRRESLHGKIERLENMSDLWVIFEIPAKEASERGHNPMPGDEDFISMLSHSQSDYSLPSLLDHSRHNGSKRRNSIKSSCKRVDLESPPHRCHCEESTDTYYSDENHYDVWSDCGDSVEESYASTICYYQGDRWSSSSTSLPTSASTSPGASPPTKKTDEPPHTPHRYDPTKSDQIPRIHCRTRPENVKLDRSPQIPRRIATSSLGEC